MIGVDEGITDIWRVTYLLPFFGESQESSGGEGEGGGDKGANKYTMYTVEAPTFFEALTLSMTSIKQKVVFIHANTIVFSENIARSGKIGEIIAPLIRNRQIRRTEFIIVSKGSAKSFLEAASSNLQTSITKEMEDLMKGSATSGYFPKINLNDLNNGIKSSYRQTIATYGAVNRGLKKTIKENIADEEPSEADDYYAGDIPREGGSKIDLLGCAVIDGDRMIGKLTDHETRIVLMVKGLLKRAILPVTDPNKPELMIPIEIKFIKRPRIKIKFKDNEPIIDIDLKIEGDILAIQSRIDYESPKLTPIVEKAVEEYIKREVDETVKKCRDELRADIFEFGNIAAMRFPTIQKWEEYSWNEHFENAIINTTVKFKIKRTGTMISDSPIITSEGKEIK
jgi:spore germination protein KC